MVQHTGVEPIRHKIISIMAREPIKPGAVEMIKELVNTRVLNDAYKLALETNNPRAELLKDNLSKGIGGLHDASIILNGGKSYSPQKPTYQDRHYPDQDGWIKLIYDEIAEFNSNGPAFITRVSECFIKTQGLINVFQSTFSRKLTYFRGQYNANWGIQSSIGRKISPSDIPTDRSTVSEFELKTLRIYQDRVLADKELQKEIFGDSKAFHVDDPGWWAVKQHYDNDRDTGGTRLIDFTSNPLCGLYFACVDWDGSVDERTDGTLFSMMSGSGRGFGSRAYLDQLHESVADDIAGDSVANYFNLNNNFTMERTVYSEEENSSRQLAQDGHFIFSPEFEKSITTWHGQGQPFTFVIPGDRKKHILRELYSLGYTPRKIVRGKTGKEAHARLIVELGIRE